MSELQLDLFADVRPFPDKLEAPLIIINPLGHPDLDVEKVQLMWSNVIGWFSVTRDRNMSALDVVRHWYSYPMHEMTGSVVDEQGVSRFPGDPPQLPLISITRYDEVVYGYAGDVISIQGALRTLGETYTTRID